MIATCDPAVRALTRRSSKHEYLLMFRASKSGVAKRVELTGDSSSCALELALADPAQRTVDIWQDGEFLCRVARDLSADDKQGAKLDL